MSARRVQLPAYRLTPFGRGFFGFYVAAVVATVIVVAAVTVLPADAKRAPEAGSQGKEWGASRQDVAPALRDASRGPDRPVPARREQTVSRFRSDSPPDDSPAEPESTIGR